MQLDTVVQVGDSVTAPEYGARPVGIVGRVDTDPASSHNTIYFALPENISALRYVHLVP